MLQVTFRDRFDGLEDACRRTLDAASVLGTRFSVEDLEAMVPVVPPSALDQAEADDLVIPVPGLPGTYRFSHGLLRQALYEAVPGSVRASYHASIAARLQADPESRVLRIEELAHHALRAGGSIGLGTCFRYLVKAGERALRLSSPSDAERWFRRALELDYRPADPELARCLGGLVHGGKASIDELVTAFELHLRSGDHAGACAVAAAQNYYVSTTDAATAVRITEQALAVVPPDTVEHGSILVQHAAHCYSAGRGGDEVATILAGAEAVAERCRSSHLRLRVRYPLPMLWLVRPAPGIDDLRCDLLASQRLRTATSEVRIRTSFAFAALAGPAVHAHRSALPGAFELARRVGGFQSHVMLLCASLPLFAAGDRSGLDLVAEELEGLGHKGEVFADTLGLEMQAMWTTGEPAEAACIALLERYRGHSRMSATIALMVAQFSYRGGLTAPLDLARSLAQHVLDTNHDDAMMAVAAAALATVAVADADAAAARHWYRQLRSEPTQPTLRGVVGTEHLLGLLAGTAFRAAAARGHLRSAVSFHERCGHDVLYAWSALDLIRILDGNRADQAIEAAQLYRQVAPLAERLAIGPLTARADLVALERDNSVGRLHRLTERELHVLRGVAAGLSNMEIAFELGISKRTVDNHLTSIYRKLEVPNRAAATRLISIEEFHEYDHLPRTG